MIDAATRRALIEAVREAARAEVMPRFRRLAPAEVGTKSGPMDLVTEADIAMEARCRSAFEAILPGVAFVGEESAAADPGLLAALGEGREAVILDPIDGTWNYAHGLAGFGTLLAVTDGADTVFGLLYDPVIDDWIWAAKGAGAHHSNGSRLGTAPARPEPEMTGVYALVGAGADEHAGLARIAPRFRRITEFRASLWDYRLMTEGRIDFAVNRMLNPWDHAAGALALTEAGGVARLADGTDYHPALREGRLIGASGEGSWRAVRDAFGPLLG